jgi:antitoxin component YwqK of YwqJK toxin-antitoxin module
MYRPGTAWIERSGKLVAQDTLPARRTYSGPAGLGGRSGMLSTIAAMLPALVLGPAPAQETAAEALPAERIELRVEAWPDGTPRVERSVRVSASGEIAHGSYVRRHANGIVAAEGAYAEGRLHGPWSTYWSSGELQSRGEFLEGRRTGKWESFHENGALAASGHYRLGLRDGKWVYLDPQGSKLAGESGYYRAQSALYPGRSRKLLAETREGRWHGRWLLWWEDGRPLVDGHYRDGVRQGLFRLWHLDGSLEPEFVSGWYAEGEPVEAPATPADPFVLPEETDADAAAASAPASGGLPRLARASGVQPSQRAALEERVARFLDDPDELQRRMAEQLLLQYGRDALPEVLNRLAELDLADPADRQRAERLVGLLQGVCKGRGFALSGAGDGPGDRLAIARWFTWFELARDQDAWWAALRENQLPPELLTPALIEGFANVEPLEVPSAGAAEPSADSELATKLSLLFRHRQNGTRPSEMREPLARALAWLAAHQSPDGSWDCSAFDVEFARRRLSPCDGAGQARYRIGVSALALLALLGDGNTTEAGAHRASVAAGLRWLLAQQDAETGAFGSPDDAARVYVHALATLVLCEVAQFTEGEAVHAPARRALEVILAAQNPGAGWRYELAPDGTSDTSVTSWMVQALSAGKAAGLVETERAFAGALSWLDAMTDKFGRVGYVTPGSRSARVPDVNDHFPTERGEALTAAALFARFLIGQDPDEVEVMGRHAGLLLQSLPEWDAEELACDLYYWLHGTEAMAQMDGSYWRAWRAALWRELFAAQRDDSEGTCIGGSWDPVGPWDGFGGRIYSTALAALCLEGEYRFPRLAK